MSDQDKAIGGQSNFFRKPFPLIYAMFELFKMEQTPFSYRYMVSGKGSTSSRPSLISKDGVWASLSNLAQNEFQSARRSYRPESAASHRRRPLHVLFVHRDAEVVDSCLEELKKAQFTVSADLVLNLAQCTVRLHSQSYDVVVAEYPSPSWKGSQTLQLLHQTVQEIPLLFVTTAMGSESLAHLTADGAFDYVEREHLARLPMAVRRVLNEKKLRAELEEAGKALRHSQSLYRALVENPAYGICRCDAEGKFLDVNQALLTMLGYETKEELLAANRASEIVLDLGQGKPLAGSAPESVRIEPVEIGWKRKNGTTLKARLSGRGVFDGRGDFVGYEIIAVDITEQRALEDHLRRQALSDSLTGLVNHRRLFEVLHAEICRSKRTEREFSLLLLDLDGLKEINDRFGHLAGNRALCRLAQTLADCCRSVDTAARQGGDEFALVLPETGVAAATLVARRICDLLAKDAEEPALSVSVGVASYPKDADTIGTLLYAADRALYAMKDKPPRAARATAPDMPTDASLNC
jgi:diguanylate cyclase (GGDEF)-like protein/PAS domain S-box-containing protein